MLPDLDLIASMILLFIIGLGLIGAVFRALWDYFTEHARHLRAERERNRVIERASRDALWRASRDIINRDPWKDTRK
jgi:hypothetical protein